MTDLSQTAVVRTSFERHGVEVLSVAQPVCAPDEVAIDVEYCGLCGSDLHIWRGDDGYGWVPVSTTLGHEIVGIVSEVGAEAAAAGFAIGDRVVPIAQTGCGECEACQRDYANGCTEKTTLGLTRQGGATSRLVVRARNVIAVPDGVDARTAVLTEPTSVAARAVAFRGKVTAGDRVVVSGPGAVGVLCALICRHLGAEVTLVGTPDDVDNRGILLAGLGLSVVTSVPGDFTPTLWIEASGAASALENALEALPAQGRLVIVALYANPPVISVNVAIRKELDIVTSYSSFRTDYELAVEVLAALPGLGDSLVQVHALGEARAAFDLIGTVSAPKVALVPLPADGICQRKVLPVNDLVQKGPSRLVELIGVL